MGQVDTLGILSGISQELKGPITSIEKLQTATPPQTLILIVENNTVLGFLKFGCKDLFFYTVKGVMVKKDNCLCLLDFYVEESHQRRGLGKKLFDAFLQVSTFF